MGSKVESSKRLSVVSLAEGLLAGNRVVLGQAITLIESNKKEDRAVANQLIEKILPFSGNAIRIGITGAPGVGKSTFIEAFGKYITALGKKLAVLAIDPSSSKTKGSILGDKTRMENLAKNPRAFIRPTAAGPILGGVANHTKETILLCEAAGFDVIIVETVGVGQSETTVRQMVDFFLLLMLAGAGDKLQGIKKGIMEMADAIVITKADNENITQAARAKNEYQQALHLFEPATSGWMPTVLTSSALTNTGLKEIWAITEKYQEHVGANGYMKSCREEQDIAWFHSQLKWLIDQIVHNFISKKEIESFENKIKEKLISPILASEEIAEQIKNQIKIGS